MTEWTWCSTTSTSNGTDGIIVNAGGVAQVHENNLAGNTGYGLRNNSAVAVSADSNWWGSAVTAEMAGGGNPKNISAIFDIYDDGTKGTVSYLPWLGSARVLAAGAVSWVRLPADGASLKGPGVVIEGSASAGAGIDRVEVSTDNGVSWRWRAARRTGVMTWTAPGDGVYQLRSRVVTLDAQLESPGVGNTLTIDSSLPTTSGTLQSDTTWSGNVTIRGDITVPAGVTLTIAAGTAVTVPRLGDDTFGGAEPSLTEITVDGNLLIQGTGAAPVVIAPSQPPLNPGDWAGITVNGTLDMSHTTIAYAETGVRCVADGIVGSCSIDNSLIRDSALNGIELDSLNGGQLTATLDTNEITDNAAGGIYAESRNGNTSSLDLLVNNNTISTNAGGGVFLFANGASGDPHLNATVSNNTVSGNSSLGVYVSTTSGAVSTVSINGNVIDANINADGIYFDNNSAGATSTQTIIGNQVSNNRFKGIRYYNQNSPISPVIQANDVQQNLDAGLHLTVGAGTNPLASPISGNTIIGNATGLFVEATGPITVSNNELHDNGAYDLYNDSANAVDARQNWWGVTTTNDLNTGGHPRNISVIFDTYDDPSKGTVDYSNWLSAFQQPLAPVVDPVTTPVTLATQTLSGTKPADTGIQINGVTVVPVDAQTTWSTVVNLSESLNSFAVKSISAEGLVSDAVDVFIVRDTTAPRILSSSPANGVITGQFFDTVQLTLYDVSTDVDMVQSAASASVELDGGPVSGTWTIDANRLVFKADSILAPGAYVVTVTTVDTPLGNSGDPDDQLRGGYRRTVVDHAQSGDHTNQHQSPAIVGYQGSRYGRVDKRYPGSTGGCPDHWQYSYPLQPGAKLLSIVAIDGAGNSSAPVASSITYDAIPPTVLSVDPAAGSYTTVQPAAVTLVLMDDSAGIDAAATITGATLTGSGGAVAGTWSLQSGDNLVFVPDAPLVEDAYTVNVSVTDLATNVTPFQSTFSYDATAPPAPTVNPVTSPTNSATQTLSGGKEAGSGIMINDLQVISPNGNTTWSYDASLTNGLILLPSAPSMLPGIRAPRPMLKSPLMILRHYRSTRSRSRVHALAMTPGSTGPAMTKACMAILPLIESMSRHRCLPRSMA